MKTLPVIVLATLIPVVALASTTNAGNGVAPIQISARADEGTIRSPDLARCQGTKCAGPGDRIRNGQDFDGAQRLAGNRGGEVSSGSKKGRRHHEGEPATPLVAGNRGGQSSAGSKKGSRHHDNAIGADVALI